MSDAPRCCPWPQCRRPLTLAAFCCGEHWRALPVEIRDAVTLAMRHGLQSAQYTEAAKHAREWMWSNAP